MHALNQRWMNALTFPLQGEDLSQGEAGQARLRFIAGSAVLGIFALAHLSGWLGTLQSGIEAVVLYVIFSYVWGVLVALDGLNSRVRKLLVVVLDAGFHAFGFWYTEAQWTVLIWLPIFVSLGNGLRYGFGMACYSTVVCALFTAGAFWLSPFWSSMPSVCVGIVLTVLVIPAYAVALAEKMQRAQREAELKAEAFEQAHRIDPLTAIYNRIGFLRALDRLMTDVKNGDAKGCLFYLDLDGFKAVNDEAGHAAGDEVLKSVALMLKESVRTADVVARLGGDEFAIVSRGVSTASDARAIATTVLKAVNTLTIPDFDHLHVGATIGICLLPSEHIEDASSATARADALMLAGKRKRKGSICIDGEPENPV